MNVTKSLVSKLTIQVGKFSFDGRAMKLLYLCLVIIIYILENILFESVSWLALFNAPNFRSFSHNVCVEQHFSVNPKTSINLDVMKIF